MTTLGREIELVEHYLDIERERFEERLQVQVDVPEQLRTLAVPCLIVQPLVENAVKHGIARSIRGGEVVVRARLEGSAPGQLLRLTVDNTGAPLADEPEGRPTRVGLNNVERRLAGHYGPRASLSLGAVAGVTRAEVRVPLSTPLTHTDTPAARAAG
jgi:LytS/YehU family sensor histidine kinase